MLSKHEIDISLDLEVQFDISDAKLQAAEITSTITNLPSNRGTHNYRAAAISTIATIACVILLYSGLKCVSSVGTATQSERSSRRQDERRSAGEYDGRLENLTHERNRRLSRVAKILEAIATKRDDSSLRQLAADMRAAKLDVFLESVFSDTTETNII